MIYFSKSNLNDLENVMPAKAGMRRIVDSRLIHAGMTV